ncbi:hypothetical protein HWV62_8245 [Athelia sp. TMB]|nr:hypothetical protein HWV62_8245 [Athelia sp. TMB]
MSDLFSDEQDSLTSIGPLLRLSNLEKLTIFDGVGISYFFDRLELPCLSFFTYSESKFGRPASWVPALTSLIHRSSCDLKSIRISNASIRSGQANLDDLMQATPHLEALQIAALEPFGSYDCRNVIRSLTMSSKDGSTSYPFPELQTLAMGCGRNFEAQAFVNMIESRWRLATGEPATHLKSVKLFYASEIDLESFRRLRAFMAEGLDIEITNSVGEALKFLL